MATYRVDYKVNTMAHLGKVYLQDRIEFVESSANKEDEDELMKDIKKTLSSLESTHEKHIKVMGFIEC